MTGTTPFQVPAKQAPGFRHAATGLVPSRDPHSETQKQGLFHLKPVLKVILFLSREGRAPAPGKSKKERKIQSFTFWNIQK